jgi:hypothetical protein
MPDMVLSLHCANADAEIIAAALRTISGAPIHLYDEAVLGRDFDDAGLGEKVTGRLRRTCIELLVEDTMIDDLIVAVRICRRRLPVRWHLVPVNRQGRLP